jgi:hypothetical protein
MTSPVTNVPPPYWNAASGFQAPSDALIMAGRIADYQNAFGGNLNLSANNTSTLVTPQGQMVSTDTAVISNVYDWFCFLTNMFDPAFAKGRYLDAIARIYFLARNSAQPTVLQIQCNGGPIPIPAGAQVVDPDGNYYVCTTGGTISGLGYVVLPFACINPGPVPIPDTVTIYQAISGWDSATVSDSGNAVGTNTDTDAAFEQRREASVESNALGIIGSIVGQIAQVPGVIDFYATDNPTISPETINGVTIAANSIYVCVAGDFQNLAVAQAILIKKPPGIPMTGTTTVTAYDNNPLYSSPRPYTVKFTIAGNIAVLFGCTLVSSNNVPSNATALIQGALQSAFLGLSATNVSSSGSSTPPRARINLLLLASSYIPIIQALGTWAQVRTLYIASQNDSNAAIFNGTIVGDALTINTLTSGSIAGGQVIGDNSGLIPPGTTIVSGSGSAWVISATLGTVGPEAMWAVAVVNSSTQVQADQEPILYSDNVTVATS